MSSRPAGKAISKGFPASLVALSLILALKTGAGAEAVPVPPELARVLSAARDDLKNQEPQKAIDRLMAFKGKDHALRHLLIGHARAQQSDLPAAASAYREALALDGDLRLAGISLAKVYVLEEKWSQAAELLGRYLEVSSCEAEHLLLYAEVARKMEDSRLFSLLVRGGILRFPGDLRFRRLDLVLLSEENDFQGAGREALRLLEQTPADAALWRQLAHARGQVGDATGRLAALEASLLSDPDNLDRHQQFLSSLLAEGDWMTVIRRGRLLLAGPLGKAAGKDLDLMEILISAADRGRRDELLGSWLGRVDQTARTRGMRLAAARRALRVGKSDEAREALGFLIQLGEKDPLVYLWAGHLAELAEDFPEAEILYQNARSSAGTAGRLAHLYLARLYLRTGSSERAEALLRSYLDSHPEDAPARALLALAEARGDG